MNQNNQQPGSAELLPCPFCGGQPRISKDSGDERNAYANLVKVQCASCGVSVSATGDTSKPGYADNSTTEKRAIEAWNRRAPSPQVAEELPPLPEPIDSLALLDGFNVMYEEAVFTGKQMEAYARDAIAASRRAKRPMPPEIQAAIAEAHKTGATSAVTSTGEAVFINYGHDLGDSAHLECTACGGSGHIEDQRANASRRAAGGEVPGDCIAGIITDKQLNEARSLYSTINHLGGMDAADSVIKKAALFGYMNGRRDFATPAPASAGQAAPASNDEIRTLRRLIECAEILDKCPRPMCRDCADEAGICPNSGLDCDMRALFAKAKTLHNKLAAQPAEGAGQAGQVAEITDGAPQWRPAVEAPRDGTRFWHIKRVVKAAVGKRPCAHYEFQVVRRKFSGEPSGGYWTNDYRSIPDSEIMCGWIIVPDCTAPTERAAAPAEPAGDQ